MEYAGEFETHITVDLDTPFTIETLQQWGVNYGLKCLHILLDRGITASQPMLTRRGKGGLSSELTAALELRDSLSAAGFRVTRIKIEAAPGNKEIPQFQTDTQNQPPNTYFEHHIKLLLEPDADIVGLAKLAEQHSAHLSRNTLRIRSDDRHERFVTQRCRSVGSIEARRQLRLLVNAVEGLGHRITKVEEEFVVYDSNLALDAGWISI